MSAPRKRHHVRRKAGPKDPAQMTFMSLFATVPQGDGSFRLIPQGKPVDELTPKEFARAVGGLRGAVSVNTVYTWLDAGEIRRDEWRRVGRRKILIQVSAVARLRDTGEI